MTTNAALIRRSHSENQVTLKIREAAVALFAERGYDRTSLQEIVDKAGFTKGAFYHYFNSKEDLLREIHDTFLDLVIDRVQGVIDRDLQPRDAVRELTAALLEGVATYPREIRISLQELPFLRGDASYEIMAKRDRFEGMVVTIIEKGIASGELKALAPPRVLAFGIIGMCSWAYHWYKPSGPVGSSEVAEAYAKVLLEGLVSDSPKPRTSNRRSGTKGSVRKSNS